MNISETKARIRRARQLIREWRQAHTDRIRGTARAHCPTGLNLSREDYDALEWGMAYGQKAWIYDQDENGKRIPGTERYVRIHGGYRLSDGTENFMFRGIPVRCAEPVGFVF